MLTQAAIEKGSTDNITTIVVFLKPLAEVRKGEIDKHFLKLFQMEEKLFQRCTYVFRLTINSFDTFLN